jgi:hypothetical protein
VKTVLLARARGDGFSHATNLRRIATRLRPHGMRPIAVVRSLAAMTSHRDVFAEVATAPPWPIDELPALQRPLGPSATMNDMLSAAGLADGDAVGRLLSVWDKIFGRIRSDLVVAGYAPLAALAARGRIPLMLAGNGFAAQGRYRQPAGRLRIREDRGLKIAT